MSQGCGLASAYSDANFSYVLRSQTQSFPAIGCLQITCSLRLFFEAELLLIVLLLALPFLFLTPVLPLRLHNFVKPICICVLLRYFVLLFLLVNPAFNPLRLARIYLLG